jgi:hypothetical protein
VVFNFSSSTLTNPLYQLADGAHDSPASAAHGKHSRFLDEDADELYN